MSEVEVMKKIQSFHDVQERHGEAAEKLRTHSTLEKVRELAQKGTVFIVRDDPLDISYTASAFHITDVYESKSETVLHVASVEFLRNGEVEVRNQDTEIPLAALTVVLERPFCALCATKEEADTYATKVRAIVLSDPECKAYFDNQYAALREMSDAIRPL